MAPRKKNRATKTLLQILGPKGGVYDDVSRTKLPKDGPDHGAIPLKYLYDFATGQPSIPRYQGHEAQRMKEQSVPDMLGRSLLKYFGGLDIDPRTYYQMPGASTTNPLDKPKPSQIKEDRKRLKINQSI
jgi:hypothetical protein